MTDSKTWHSRYYHKRFEGWMEKAVDDGKGRKHIERVYTGDYFYQDLTEKKRLSVRVAYGILYALSAACFVFASARDTGSNRAFFNQLLCFLTLLPMVALLAFLPVYMASPRRMTVWEHFAGPARVQDLSLATAVLLASEAVAVLIFLVFHRNDELASELINFAGYLAASLAMFAINRVEKGIKYVKTPSGTEPLRGGSYID